jgi:hypothetical protein
MKADYSKYVEAVSHIVLTKDVSSFKRHPAYEDILEHVSYPLGLQYLNLIKNSTQIPDSSILLFCKLNDKVGNPKLFDFGDFEASPTSLRYIWHAHTILTYLKTLNKTSHYIVEVGGGYGGLCLALDYFAPFYGVTISSYTIVDLKEINQLQTLYLQTVKLSYPVHFVDAATFGKDIPLRSAFLISNYCFSEVGEEYQKKYLEHLFPKIEHGFMAWNFIPLYKFRDNVRQEEETPKTGYFNCFVYF